MTPIKYGRPFMPGDRICGHKDCVEKSHVIESGIASKSEDQQFRELFDDLMAMAQRTGTSRNYFSLLERMTNV
jgi:hypothetical protein